MLHAGRLHLAALALGIAALATGAAPAAAVTLHGTLSSTSGDLLPGIPAGAAFSVTLPDGSSPGTVTLVIDGRSFALSTPVSDFGNPLGAYSFVADGILAGDADVDGRFDVSWDGATGEAAISIVEIVAGDVDRDGIVGGSDVLALRFDSAGPGDFTGDGVVGGPDVMVQLANYGTRGAAFDSRGSLAPDHVANPEPTAAVLFLVGGLLVVRSSSRRARPLAH